jgi:hypothetical protein
MKAFGNAHHALPSPVLSNSDPEGAIGELKSRFKNANMKML